jgi:hypothetical protein
MFSQNYFSDDYVNAIHQLNVFFFVIRKEIGIELVQALQEMELGIRLAK